MTSPWQKAQSTPTMCGPCSSHIPHPNPSTPNAIIDAHTQTIAQIQGQILSLPHDLLSKCHMMEGLLLIQHSNQHLLCSRHIFFPHQLGTNIQQRIYWHNFSSKRLEDLASSSLNIFIKSPKGPRFSPPIITTNTNQIFSTTGSQGA